MLCDHARASLQNRRRTHITLRIEELRHPDFFPQNSCYLCHFLIPVWRGALARVPFQRGLSYWLGSFGLAPSLVCVACIPFKSFGFVFAYDRRLFMFFPERLD